MTELKDLSKEKQQELLDVKMCCKISEQEFEKRFDTLPFVDQKILVFSIIDTEMKSDVLTCEVEILNDKVLDFLQLEKYETLMYSCIMDLKNEKLEW